VLVQTVATLDAEADLPRAPLTVADTLVLTGLAYTARPAATRTFGRRPDEVPAVRRFVREPLNGHQAAFDAELLARELVTNTVQHATDADWATIAVSRRAATVHVDVMNDGQAGLRHWREATGEDEGGRGFQLVNEIAQRWGFLRERGRTCVWPELVPGDC
jgi:anti-sigma regulatory factor (Ser/Thr protein kinase)